ncbi:MAG: two-component system, sensor histidine kinase and response regulator [Thermoanaerobaculia bacterium]|jgi:signal transduction histidine kinase/CheY-like chemotaxis protein|nr:two-component system, sensor histidine kinase and response regulator [Thermoanaerobaculia bacterium]
MSRDLRVVTDSGEQPRRDRELRGRFALAAGSALCFIAASVGDLVGGGHAASLVMIVLKTVLVLAGVTLMALALRSLSSPDRDQDDALEMSQESKPELDEPTVAAIEERIRAGKAGVETSELFAHITHELRTPLQNIVAILQNAIDSEPSTERALQLDLARRSAVELLTRVGDVLDFTRLEARGLELEPVYSSLRQLLADTLKPLGITAAEKGLTFAYGVAAEVPDRLWCDPSRLRQVLVNLAGNAIKFTQRGEVVLRVSCGNMSVNQVTILFEVSDTGVGIDSTLRPMLMEAAGASRSPQRRHSGAGLGLPIVLRLLDIMGGTLSVESEPGKGSTFRVTLPLPCEPIGAEPRPEWESRLEGIRVLLIEPHAMTRALLAQSLAAHGIVPEAYATLDRALRPSIRAAYACLVAEASVIDTTPWIPPVPVVRIASPLAAADLTGVVIRRPVSEQELIEAVGAALGVVDRGVAFTLERRSQSPRPLRALIVDADAVNQELLAEAVRRAGNLVSVAATVEEAIDLLVRKVFDVILAGVQTPGIDELELPQRFRAGELHARIAMVAVTTNASSDERERWIAAGFDEVLRMPATPAAIKAVFRDVSGPLIPSEKESTPGDSPLDAVGGNARMLHRVRDAFETQVPRMLDAMRTAIEAGDRDAVCENARTLRGAISNFDAPAAIAGTLQIERAVTAGDFARANALLPEIEEGIRKLQETIDAALE